MAVYVPSTLTPRTLARAQAINAELQAIAAALANVPDGTEINEGRQNYVAGGGVANAYTATLSPAPAGYVEGLSIRIKWPITNTGPATVNVNGLGLRAIKTALNVDPSAGDLNAGGIADITYDGTAFRLVHSQVEPSEAVLRALLPLVPAANQIIYYTGASTAALTALTAFARTLLDDNDATAARATLGLGTAAMAASSAFAAAVHAHAIADVTGLQSALDAKADKTIRIVGGAGLIITSPDDDLGDNVTLALGAPGTVTKTSTNEATADSHTHAIDADGVVSEGMAARAEGSIGTFALLRHDVNDRDILWGDIVTGSSVAPAGLRTSGAAGTQPYSSGLDLSGSWKAMGAVNTASDERPLTLFLRIS